MARLMCTSNGNNTNAATWAVIDSTSFNESESSTTTVPNTYSASSTLRQFTPGAITVDGVAIRVGARTGTTGTLSVELYNHTGAASVVGSEVTVNMTDVVDGGTVQVDGGWMFFKFSAPILLLAATVYVIRVKTSASSQMSVYAGGSLATLNGFLRTTTTQAPVAGDDRFVMGEWTAAATMTTRTVTLNDTGAAVDYGSASTSQVTPALSISNGGIVLAGTTAATTYVQKISGNVVVYNGGILRLATSGSRMPTDSSFTWTFDCGANVDFGIDVRRKGEFTAYGESKTRWTLLTGDEAAAQTVIGVVDTTGWKVSDTLVFAPTGTTTTHGETKNILTVDSGVQVTLTAGLTNAHTGTGDVVGEVGNLTSNVKIVGISTTVGTFITFKESSLGVLDNIEVQYYGSGTSSKRGVECQHINTSTNSATFNSCSFRDCVGGASSTVGSTPAAGNLFYITNNVVTNSSGAAATGILATGGSTGTPTFDVSGNFITGQSSVFTTGLNMSLVTGVGGTCTNNRIAGCSTGVSWATGFLVDVISEISGFKVHSCSTGISNNSQVKKTITSCDIVCNGTGLAQPLSEMTITSCNFYGNSVAGVLATSGGSGTGYVNFNSCVFRGRTSFAQPIGVSFTGTGSLTSILIFNLCTFGVTTAHTTSDLNVSGYQGVPTIFNSCTFASSTEITSTAHTFFSEYGSIQIQRKDNTDGNHVMYVKQGIITPDTTIFRTASPSLRIAPKSATITCSNKLATFKAFVSNGQTCTPTVYVRESVVGDGTDYNGNFAKLYVKANYNLGITSDTLLDTATALSTGAWEALTGATAAVTDDGVLEFYVVLDGTTGWLNIDDFSFTNA